MVPHPPQSNELDKALKADLRASHFSIGALGDAEKVASSLCSDRLYSLFNSRLDRSPGHPMFGLS